MSAFTVRFSGGDSASSQGRLFMTKGRGGEERKMIKCYVQKNRLDYIDFFR